MRRLVDVLDRASLVDRAVDDDRSRAHRAHHRVGDDDGCAPAGHEHRADDEVGFGDRAVDGEAVARQRHDPALVDLVDPAQPVEVAVEEQHLGLHALRDPRRVPSHVAGADHHDARRPNAGCTTEQHAPPAVRALEEVRAHLRRHPTGDLAHRCEQRERARLDLHGLVGDAHDLVREQRVGDLGVCGEMEIGEEHQPRSEERELFRLRLLDLQDELGARPHVGGARDQLRARGPVVVVRERRAGAGALLDEHRHAVHGELVDAVRRDRDAVFAALELARHTDGEGCGHPFQTRHGRRAASCAGAVTHVEIRAARRGSHGCGREAGRHRSGSAPR